MEFDNISHNIRNVIRKRFLRVPEHTRHRSRGIREIRKTNGTISVIDTLRVHEKLERGASMVATSQFPDDVVVVYFFEKPSPVRLETRTRIYIPLICKLSPGS